MFTKRNRNRRVKRPKIKLQIYKGPIVGNVLAEFEDRYLVQYYQADQEFRAIWLKTDITKMIEGRFGRAKALEMPDLSQFKPKRLGPLPVMRR